MSEVDRWRRWCWVWGFIGGEYHRQQCILLSVGRGYWS